MEQRHLEHNIKEAKPSPVCAMGCGIGEYIERGWTYKTHIVSLVEDPGISSNHPDSDLGIAIVSRPPNATAYVAR